jgi:hypothetical protein
MSAWDHKDAWRRFGKDFMVEITRHSVARPESSPFDDGPHRWCVYAYIYPKHPHFAAFSGRDMWQDAAVALPLHGGPSLLRWHYNDNGEPTSVQVGADYNHLHDNHYTHFATAEDAYSVFLDADELFERLAAHVEKAA